MVVSARRGGRRGARVIAPAATLAVMAVSGLRSMMCPVQVWISNVAEFSDDAPCACRDLVRCAARRSQVPTRDPNNVCSSGTTRQQASP